MHITAGTWMLELTSNLIPLAIRYFELESKTAILVLFEVFWLNTLVLIPSMYVLNTDKVKSYLNGIELYGALIERFRSKKVAPNLNQNVEMNVLPNVSTTSKSEDIVNETSFTAKHNSRKLLKAASDSQILNNVKATCRKMSI